MVKKFIRKMQEYRYEVTGVFAFGTIILWMLFMMEIIDRASKSLVRILIK